MNEFITIDFETAKHSRESAIAIGLVKYRDYLVVDTFYSLICPPKLYIRPDFTDIHGLTVDDVKDAPTFDGIWESKIKPFIGRLPLAAHNAPFDMSVLKAVLKWYKLPVPKLKFFCTCALARNFWTERESHSLTSLAENFGIVYNAHNALDDAMTCGKLVYLAAEECGLGISLDELLDAGRVEMKMLF
jgi:DNA polymerase-3 subunit epsilon